MYRINRCPRCDNLLMRDHQDVFCMFCGWRVSFYYPCNDMETSWLLETVISRYLVSNNSVIINSVPSNLATKLLPKN